MGEPLIRVRNLVKSFGGRTVLRDINMDIERGRITVIMGGSGDGKSTLLRHLIGALKPDSGEIWFKDKDITKFNEEEMDDYRKRFGMLFQGGALLNSLTVKDNVALPIREHTNLDEKIISIMIKMKLELVGLRDFEHLKPAQLSGGMQKRVSLARAIALDPEIVFYDEPTSGLDPITGAVIDQLMIDLSRKLNITSLVVTHDTRSAFKIADKMVMLCKGRIVQQGTPKEIQESTNPWVSQFIRGNPDGAIPLEKSRDEYLRDLGLVSE